MFLSSLISFFLLVQVQPQAELQINVKGINTPSGYIMIAVYNSDRTFLTTEVITGEKFMVNKSGNMICPVNLELGDYAISIYHDVNGNGELDSSLFKIPKEPTGFSNNVKGVFGPPDYDKVQFSFERDGQEISIELN